MAHPDKKCENCGHGRSEHRFSKSDMGCNHAHCDCKWFLPPGHTASVIRARESDLIDRMAAYSRKGDGRPLEALVAEARRQAEDG